ncbi:MAG: kelch repeat-containing protein [Bacteroidetes bacterium]|nr:MAG: kelch repeat-containing protein [Bacteroidota bacterium]
MGEAAAFSFYYNDFWEYNPALNTWTQKANSPGATRLGASVFTIANKAYIGTGQSQGFYNDLWEYDAITNTTNIFFSPCRNCFRKTLSSENTKSMLLCLISEGNNSCARSIKCCCCCSLSPRQQFQLLHTSLMIYQ